MCHGYKNIDARVEYLGTGPASCGIHTIVTKIMGRKNGGHLKDGILLDGAVCYVRLFCLPRHSYVTATVLGKQVFLKIM